MKRPRENSDKEFAEELIAFQHVIALITERKIMEKLEEMRKRITSERKDSVEPDKV